MNPLDEVLIISEAALMWNLDTSTLRIAIIRGKRFTEDEYCKTEPGGTIKILRSAMVRLYGEPKPILYE